MNKKLLNKMRKTIKKKLGFHFMSINNYIVIKGNVSGFTPFPLLLKIFSGEYQLL